MRSEIYTKMSKIMPNLMWRQRQSDRTKLVRPQITPQIFMGMLMPTSRFLMSGLNLWLHTGLSDLDVLTVVIILVSSVRQAGGLNLPQLDWLMFSLSFTTFFVVSWRAGKHTACRFWPANSWQRHWKCFFFLISFGKCWGTWFVDRPFCPLIFHSSSCSVLAMTQSH